MSLNKVSFWKHILFPLHILSPLHNTISIFSIWHFCVYLELCLFIHRLGRINYAFNHSRESPDGVTTQDHISSSSTNEDENLSEEVDEFGNYLYIFSNFSKIFEKHCIS